MPVNPVKNFAIILPVRFSGLGRSHKAESDINLGF